MSKDNPQAEETGIFDEDDHALMSNQSIGEMPVQDAPSSYRNLLIFLAIIILIIVGVNHMYSNTSKATPDQTAEEVKKKLLRPILEEIQPEERTLNHNTAEGNQTLPNKSLTKLSENPLEQKPLSLLKGQLKQNNQQKTHFQKSPLPSLLDNSGSESVKKAQKVKQNPSLRAASDNSAEKNYPISQKLYDQRIYAGQIHYSRIPVQYWEHRILMLKAMGLNTLSVYVMWNYHEVERGSFDFSTENKNITKFLELAVKHKMKVLLRPGPYVCAEWDFGGLPARLLGISGLKIRSFNQLFLQEVDLFFKALSPIIKPYLWVNKGPIRMIQIQNQLGSFSSDPDYTKALVDIWKKYSIDCQFYIEDAAFSVRNNYLPGLAIGVSDGSHQHDYSQVGLDEKIEKGTLIFGGEIYTGWMTHWGERWGDNPMEKFNLELQYLFQSQKEFSLYMAHGGTNFGLTAGANAGIHQLSYEPMVTSYDYNAPITEQGRKTMKSDLIVDLMKMYVRPPAISFPDPYPVIKIDKIYPKLTASLMEHLGEPFLKNQESLYYFQHQKIGMYNQGIMVYQTFIEPGAYMVSMQIHDFGLLFLDHDVLGQFSRIRTDEVQANITCKQNRCRIRILVQAMGHNNYGTDQQEDIKGLIRCTVNSITNQTLTQVAPQWNMYKVNIDQSILAMDKISRESVKYPAIFKQHFNITNTIGDTYINMQAYGKGYVWVNGRNLGRYWHRGPQFRLYCPGVWLKKENNQIVILEMLSAQEVGISGEQTMENRLK